MWQGAECSLLECCLTEISCLTVQTKFQIDFQAGDYGGHTGFPIRINLIIFNLQVTKILPTMFQVNWPFGSEEVQNRFLR